MVWVPKLRVCSWAAAAKCDLSLRAKGGTMAQLLLFGQETLQGCCRLPRWDGCLGRGTGAETACAALPVGSGWVCTAVSLGLGAAGLQPGHSRETARASAELSSCYCREGRSPETL